MTFKSHPSHVIFNQFRMPKNLEASAVS